MLQSDYPLLEKVVDKVVKEKQKFERLVVPKEILLEMFAVSELNLSGINNIWQDPL